MYADFSADDDIKITVTNDHAILNLILRWLETSGQAKLRAMDL